MNKYEFIKAEKAGEKQNVGLVTLNRPKALNALCQQLITELNDAMEKFDLDESIGALVLTGSEKAFAAGKKIIPLQKNVIPFFLLLINKYNYLGADIKEMASNTFAGNLKGSFLQNWSDISKIRKPIIAAVNGYAVCS